MGLFSKKKLTELQKETETTKAHTILIVDDEEANLRVLEEMLERDYTVLTAKDGKDALEVVQRESKNREIHLIISDQRMPGLTGVEFLEQTIPIIPNSKRMILTGFTDVEVIIDAINKGQIYKFMLKPYDLDDMRLNVKRALEAFDLEEKNAKLVAELQEAMDSLQLSLVRQAEAEKMAVLGGYVAGIVHEVNTPLGITITASSHLEDKIDQITKKYDEGTMSRKDLERFLNLCKESASIIRTNQERAAELMRSFKDIAVDQSSNERRKFKVNEYIHEILLSLRPKLKKTDHIINVECSEKLIINSYPGAFSQILTNFIMNSLIHGFEHIEVGEINITISQEEDKIHLNYKDNGKGLEEEDLEKLFDAFFTTKRETGGSGMGTHIVHNLVTSTLGGTIDCKSKPGEGLEYIIIFPIK